MTEANKTLLNGKIEIPDLPTPSGNFVPAKIVDKIIYTSGQTGKIKGVLKHRGRVGGEITIEEAYESAGLACLNCLAQIKYVTGSLDSIDEIVDLLVFVSSTDDFYEQPKVANGASDFLIDLFGEKGRHTRAALGVKALPGNAPVEVKLVAKLK